MLIRPLCETDDRLAVSRVYEISWKYAYRGIVPQSYLDSIPSGRWANRIDQLGFHNLVLLEDGLLIGTAAYCGARTEEFAGYGELVSLYLLPEYIGKGYGRSLLNASLQGLAAIGFRDVYLWVLERNRHARRFYEEFGFTNAGIYLDSEISGKSLCEIQYRYHI